MCQIQFVLFPFAVACLEYVKVPVNDQHIHSDVLPAEWMADGREKYWNGIREDVKESKVDRV
jgi:hypothetical protein